MKKSVKILIGVIITLILLWGIVFSVDFFRCRNFKMPIFVVAGKTADDGGSGIYYGLGYKVNVEKSISAEYGEQLEKVEMYFLNKFIAGAIADSYSPLITEKIEQTPNNVVDISISGVENLEELNEFIGKMDYDNENRTSDTLKIIKYTEEGDKAYTSLNYIKETETFELIIDNREDKFAAEENKKIIKNTYSAELYEIVKEERDDYIDIKLTANDYFKANPLPEDIIICSYNKKYEKSYSFYAYVILSNNNRNYIKVRPEQNTKELNKCDSIFIYFEKDEYPIFEDGTYVKITYDGIIRESNPAKIEASNIEFIREPQYCGTTE